MTIRIEFNLDDDILCRITWHWWILRWISLRWITLWWITWLWMTLWWKTWLLRRKTWLRRWVTSRWITLLRKSSWWVHSWLIWLSSWSEFNYYMQLSRWFSFILKLKWSLIHSSLFNLSNWKSSYTNQIIFSNTIILILNIIVYIPNFKINHLFI